MVLLDVYETVPHSDVTAHATALPEHRLSLADPFADAVRRAGGPAVPSTPR